MCPWSSPWPLPQAQPVLLLFYYLFIYLFIFLNFPNPLFFFSTVEHGDPVAHTYRRSFFSHCHAPSSVTRHSSQCYAAGSHCISIPKATVCIYSPQAPHPSHSLPLLCAASESPWRLSLQESASSWARETPFQPLE